VAKHSVGLIGGGQVARSHMIGFGNVPLFYGPQTTADVRVIAEASEGLASSAAARLGVPRWTSDWHQVTQDPEIEIVDVMTPTYLHKQPAIEAMEGGKDVICEKPLAALEQDAHEMYDVSRRTNARTVVGFNYRRVPAVTLAKQMIEDGKLGKVYHVRSHFMEDWGGPEFPLTWRFHSEQAGAGALADLGSHALDMVRYLVGEPTEVCGSATNFIPERTPPGGKMKLPSDVDDVVVALLKLEGGALAEVSASWISTGRKVQLDFEVQGSEGTVYFTMERPNELNYYSARDAKQEQGFKQIYFGPSHKYGGTLLFSSPTMGAGYVDSVTNQMHDFLEAVERDEECSPSFYDGWRVSRLIAAILESTRKKAWVDIT
jgi:levoglucosan dehydrogenase